MQVINWPIATETKPSSKIKSLGDTAVGYLEKEEDQF